MPFFRPAFHWVVSARVVNELRDEMKALWGELYIRGGWGGVTMCAHLHIWGLDRRWGISGAGEGVEE